MSNKIKPEDNTSYDLEEPHHILHIGILTKPPYGELLGVDMRPDGQTGNLLITNVNEDIDFHGRTLHIQLKITTPAAHRPRVIPRE